jgi:hypothetical protein
MRRALDLGAEHTEQVYRRHVAVSMLSHEARAAYTLAGQKRKLPGQEREQEHLDRYCWRVLLAKRTGRWTVTVQASAM